MSERLPEVGRRARARISLRLLPMVFAMYVVCYMDRTNVSFAGLRMNADLGMNAQAYGFGVGVFFIGYVLFEVPGALIVERWSARKWMARIMISWGLLTILTGFVNTPRQFYVARTLVGLSEASFFPGIIVYLTHWFRIRDRAKAIGFFYTGVPVSSILGSLIAGMLLGVHWLGMAGWRWLFIMEGIPPIVLGVVALFYLTDWPSQARWLPQDERDWITTELQSEAKAKKEIRDYTIWEAFRDRQVLLLVAGWLFALVAALGSTYFLPTFIKRLSGLADTSVALLIVLPGILGVTATLLNGWHSDKTLERRWHSAIPLLVAGSCYFLLLVPGIKFAVAMLFLTSALAMFNAFQTVFWSIPTTILCESAAAASFGLINSIGQIGGFVGPYVIGYLNDKTGHLSAAFAFIGVCYLVSGSIIPLLRLRSPVRFSEATGLLEQPAAARL